MDKQWDVLIPAGKSASLLVTVSGTIAYFCHFHSMMKGTVAVGE
jgi:plastocyanin